MALDNLPIAFPKLDDEQMTALGKFAKSRPSQLGEKHFAAGDPG